MNKRQVIERLAGLIHDLAGTPETLEPSPFDWLPKWAARDKAEPLVVRARNEALEEAAMIADKEVDYCKRTATPPGLHHIKHVAGQIRERKTTWPPITAQEGAP